MKWRNALLLSLLLILPMLAPGTARADCSSKSCADCQQNRRGTASCLAVTYSASCSCSIDVQTPSFCLLEGACTYTGSGGGGGGGGGGNDPGSCSVAPGGWCPAECQSCQTVFWY